MRGNLFSGAMFKKIKNNPARMIMKIVNKKLKNPSRKMLAVIVGSSRETE